MKVNMIDFISEMQTAPEKIPGLNYNYQTTTREIFI